MSEYYPGYIFRDGDDYPEIAAWCNANDCYIKELPRKGASRNGPRAPQQEGGNHDIADGFQERRT